MKTYKHQESLIKRNPARQCLVWSTGSGKTLALLSLAQKNLVSEVLIVVPKSNKEQWWAKIKEYGITVPYNVMTKEEMRRDWKILPRYEAVIYDEVHHASGHSSQMHKSFHKYLVKHKPRYVWTGTATPYRSTPFNIWSLARLHGLDLNWIKFREVTHHIRYLGMRMIWEKNEDEKTRQYLHQLLSQFSDFVKLEDCFDVPDQIDMEPEIFDLSKAQKQAIASAKLEDSNPLVLTSKMHQIEAGSLKGNEFVPDTEDLESAKDARILELASEHPKLLVFCRYTLQIKRLTKKLRDAGHIVYDMTGENSDIHYEVTQRAEKHDKCVVVAQISCAAGWELPSFSHVVYASMSYSLLEAQQSRGRVIRANKLGKHVFMYLHGGPTDKAVMASIMDKRDFDPATFEMP